MSITRTRFNRWAQGAGSLFTLGVMAIGAVAIGGCAESPDKSASMEQRQDAAIKDPFSYGPDVPTAGARRTAPPVAEPQPKDESLKSEWQRFWNP